MATDEEKARFGEREKYSILLMLMDPTLALTSSGRKKRRHFYRALMVNQYIMLSTV